MHPLAKRFGDGPGEGKKGAFAVGAGNMQNRGELLFGVVEGGKQALNTPKRKVDRLRMQLLQPLEQSVARRALWAGRGSPGAVRKFGQSLVP